MSCAHRDDLIALVSNDFTTFHIMVQSQKKHNLGANNPDFKRAWCSDTVGSDLLTDDPDNDTRDRHFLRHEKRMLTYTHHSPPCVRLYAWDSVNTWTSTPQFGGKCGGVVVRLLRYFVPKPPCTSICAVPLSINLNSQLPTWKCVMARLHQEDSRGNALVAPQKWVNKELQLTGSQNTKTDTVGPRVASIRWDNACVCTCPARPGGEVQCKSEHTDIHDSSSRSSCEAPGRDFQLEDNKSTEGHSALTDIIAHHSQSRR